MKNLFRAGMILLFLGSGLITQNSHAEEINVYIWSEYIDPEMVTDFEKNTGIKVNLSLYESSEEMLAKIQYAGGASQYDVVVVSNMMVPLMSRLELLKPLDHTQIPNRKNLEAEFLNPSYDPKTKYSLAYQWGTVGLMYNKAKFPNLDPSWSVILDRKKEVGTFILLDEMRDQLGVALVYLGYSSNTTDTEQVKKAGQLLIDAKKSPNAQGFEGGVGGKNRVASGAVDMAVVWNGDALRAISEDENDQFAYIVPREGSIVWADVMAIPIKAPNTSGAHKFINYILDAKVGAQLSTYTEYASPNKASKKLLDKETLENPVLYPPASAMKKLEYQQDVGKHTQLYDVVWTAVKSQ
ncbi:MAG: polyamine ABC transporter substrate-binding protein [Candidatus Latescibacterota bacterium]